MCVSTRVHVLDFLNTHIWYWHEYIMKCTWFGHGTHVSESWHTFQWIMTSSNAFFFLVRRLHLVKWLSWAFTTQESQKERKKERKNVAKVCLCRTPVETPLPLPPPLFFSFFLSWLAKNELNRRTKRVVYVYTVIRWLSDSESQFLGSWVIRNHSATESPTESLRTQETVPYRCRPSLWPTHLLPLAL